MPAPLSLVSVDINDPGVGFSVSKFGKRKIVNRLVSFELPQA